MTTRLLAGRQHIWREITAAAKKASRADVAVAYFAEGAAELLPLKKGSRLVVDASLRSVRAGASCPDELLKLQSAGVAIYSAPNLHAKVFAFPRQAFIGSVNASHRSASLLTEAVVVTRDLEIVSGVRRFVGDLARSSKLGPEKLKELAEEYTPPDFLNDDDFDGFEDRAAGVGHSVISPETLSGIDPVVWVSGYEWATWSDELSESVDDATDDIVQARDIDTRVFEVSNVVHDYKPDWAEDEHILWIDDEHPKSLVHAPGRVLKVYSDTDGGRRVWITCTEHERRRRVAYRTMCKALGHGWLKRLNDYDTFSLTGKHASAVLTYWDRKGMRS